MSIEREPLIQHQDAHFEISYQTDLSFADVDASGPEPDRSNGGITVGGDRYERKNGATVFQTSLNIAKLCMGTGTLALPFAAQQGGLVFNAIGLGVIVVWNYYSADCLLRCLDYLPREALDAGHISSCNTTCYNQQEQSSDSYGATENVQTVKCNMTMPGPPEGTTTYGAVAWYAFGKPGLIVLDLLMIMLSVGLLIAYQGKSYCLRTLHRAYRSNFFIILICLCICVAAAIFSFVDTITQDRCSRLYGKILPSLVIAVLSCAKDISFLSRFSAFGLIALAFSFR
jgi:hypothetical protein